MAIAGFRANLDEPNRSSVARISLAFNPMLIGNFGSAGTFAAGYVAP